MLTVLLVRAQKEMRSIQNASIILKKYMYHYEKIIAKNRNRKILVDIR